MNISSSIGTAIDAMLAGNVSEQDVVRQFQEWEGKALTAQDVASAARVMRSAMIPVSLLGSPIDTCGTGGSGKERINVSTLVAFIVAAAGGQVAKHGNKAASGRCGCFDLLESIGATIDLTPEQEQAVFHELGIVFLFARTHHPAMRHVAGARKAFGKPTIFNLLGPLANPANVKRQLLGTPTLEKARLLRDALILLGSERSWVVTGEDGLDEVTVCGATTVLDSSGGERRFSPKDIRLSIYRPHDIVGGTIGQNTAVFMDLIHGKGHDAHRNLVTLNAAHALALAGIALTVQAGAVIASDILRSGRLVTLVKQYIEATNDYSSDSSVSLAHRSLSSAIALATADGEGGSDPSR